MGGETIVDFQATVLQIFQMFHAKLPHRTFPVFRSISQINFLSSHTLHHNNFFLGTILDLRLKDRETPEGGTVRRRSAPPSSICQSGAQKAQRN